MLPSPHRAIVAHTYSPNKELFAETVGLDSCIVCLYLSVQSFAYFVCKLLQSMAAIQNKPSIIPVQICYQSTLQLKYVCCPFSKCSQILTVLPTPGMDNAPVTRPHLLTT